MTSGVRAIANNRISRRLRIVISVKYQECAAPRHIAIQPNDLPGTEGLYVRMTLPWFLHRINPATDICWMCISSTITIHSLKIAAQSILRNFWLLETDVPVKHQ